MHVRLDKSHSIAEPFYDGVAGTRQILVLIVLSGLLPALPNKQSFHAHHRQRFGIRELHLATLGKLKEHSKRLLNDLVYQCPTSTRRHMTKGHARLPVDLGNHVCESDATPI